MSGKALPCSSELKLRPNIASTLMLSAGLRAWPGLAASAPVPLTTAEAHALEKRFLAFLQSAPKGKAAGSLARSLALTGRAGFFFFLAGVDGDHGSICRRDAGLGRFRYLEPTASLAIGLCLRVAESRGGYGFLAWLRLADQVARLLGHDGFHGVVAGRSWQGRKASRLMLKRGLGLEDVLAGRLAAGMADREVSPVEAVPPEELRPLAARVRTMQKAFKAGVAMAVSAMKARQAEAEAPAQAGLAQAEAFPAGSAGGGQTGAGDVPEASASGGGQAETGSAGTDLSAGADKEARGQEDLKACGTSDAGGDPEEEPASASEPGPGDAASEDSPAGTGLAAGAGEAAKGERDGKAGGGTSGAGGDPARGASSEPGAGGGQAESSPSGNVPSTPVKNGGWAFSFFRKTLRFPWRKAG